MILNFIFFLFPFLIYTGIAVQGISFYAIGILIPALFVTCIQKRKLPSYFIHIGLCFLALHILFPITNFIAYFFPNKAVPTSIYEIQWKWPGIFQSNFPSSLFFGGLALVLLSLTLGPKKIGLDPLVKPGDDKVNLEDRTSLNPKDNRIHPLKSFLTGLSFASVLFLCALVYQHTSGIDLRSLFRSHIEYLGQNDAFKDGTFRVYGFYGHPLTAAGVSLAYCIFSWSLLWSWLGKNRSVSYSFIPFHNKKYAPLLVLSVISISNGVVVLLSGGRTASVTGLILFALIPFFFYAKKSLLKSSAAVLLISAVSFFFIKNSAFLNRIESTSEIIVKNQSFDNGNNRMIFWKIYEHLFIDHPIFGQGNYWLKQGVRDEYYNRLGYESLTEKFPAHNIYLEILGSAGILGMIWVIFSCFFLFRTLKKDILTKDKHLDILWISFSFAFLANLIHGLTQNVFFDSSVVYIYICLILVFLWEKTFTSTE